MIEGDELNKLFEKLSKEAKSEESLKLIEKLKLEQSKGQDEEIKTSASSSKISSS